MVWLSWRGLAGKIKDIQGPIASDLAALLERLDLRLFHGIGEVTPLSDAVWTFAAPRPAFGWDYETDAEFVEWSFKP